MSTSFLGGDSFGFISSGGGGGGLTSVGLSMPSAFTVSNSPLIANGVIAVSGAGTSSQYVRGDGQLANFPDNSGGGSSVNYYLNGSVNQGSFGGTTYYEMSTTPILGAGTNFTRTNAQGNGYIASFITDVGDPSLLNIPGGNWNLEFYFSASSGGGSPLFYAELYKVSASNVFTIVASGSSNPEGISNGTIVDQYFTSIPVPQTSLLVTDRLAIRIFVVPSGRTITLHTENSNLCEVLTTFSTGLNALNGLTAQVQYFATDTSGTDFAITSATDTHTFNLPTASATNRGALSSADWSTFSGKVGGSGATGQVAYWNGTSSQTGSNNLFWDAANARLGIGTSSPSYALDIVGTSRIKLDNNLYATSLFVENINTGTGALGTIIFKVGGTTIGQMAAVPSNFITPALRSTFLVGSLGNNKVGIVANTDNTGVAQDIYFSTFGGTDAKMTLTAAGRLLLGTTTESTFLLDVNGTARVSGEGVINEIKVTRNGTASGNYCTYIGNSSWGATALQYNTFVGGAISVGAGNRNVGIGSAVTITGTANVAIGHNAVASGSAIAIGASTWALANTAVFGSSLYPIGDVYFGNGVQRSSDGAYVSGTGQSVSINASGGFGTNQIGGTLTIAGGKGTGSGASGDVVISTATPTTSGTTLQSLTQRLRIKGTEGSVRFIPIATPSSAEAGDVYYDSSTNKLRCYNGTSWNDLF